MSHSCWHGGAEASDALRGLIHRIVVTPNAGDTGSTAMLEGDLAELLWFAGKRPG
jgi:hypothetical protein